MNLLLLDFLSAECESSDLLEFYQAEIVCHCNTQEPSCRSKKMSYANSSTTEEQWMFIEK